MAKLKQADTKVGDIHWLEPGYLPPKGWCYADGRTVGRRRYADLYARYGTSCGDGNGKTTFNIPRVQIRRKGAGYLIPIIRLI